MKKIYTLLLMLLPFTFLASCDSEDQFPEVKLGANISGVTQVDGVYYAVAGETVTVNEVTCKPVVANATALTGVDYYLNYTPLAYSNIAPYTLSFVMERTGDYTLQMYTNILQVDKRVTSALIAIPIRVVGSSAEIPNYDRTIHMTTYTLNVCPSTQPK